MVTQQIERASPDLLTQKLLSETATLGLPQMTPRSQRSPLVGPFALSLESIFSLIPGQLTYT